MGRIVPLARLSIGLTGKLMVWLWWLSASLAMSAVAAWWVGAPTAVRMTAADWLRRFANPLFPSAYDPYLYHGAIVLATVATVAGWIVAAHFTVFLFGVIF